MTQLYTAQARSTGGRNGRSETTDGSFKFDMASPGAPNAKPGTTNPEQLFAIGYAACFGGALEYIAKQQKLDATGAAVTADVTLNKNDSGFFLSVVLNADLPNLERAQAEGLMEATHQFCPYSKATRGNVDVALKVNNVALKKAA